MDTLPTPTENRNVSQTSDGTSSIPPSEEMQHVFQPSRRFLFAFISILIITLAAALDATSLSIALPIFTDKLDGTAIEAFWAGTSFLLTSAVFQPVIAGLSHVFGRKNLIIVSSLVFAVGSVVAAVATDFTMMYVEGGWASILVWFAKAVVGLWEDPFKVLAEAGY